MKFEEPLKKYYFSSASKTQKEIFNICKEKALESEMRSKHCACLVRKGKIIHLECNHYGGDKNSYSLHAEPTLHKKILKNNKIRKNHKYDLYIIRYSEASGFMNSKPCVDCTKYIKYYMDYVNKIIYSNDDKTYIKVTRETLTSNHTSHGYKNFRKNKYNK